MDGLAGGLLPLESFRAPARIGHVGREHLHFRRQIARAGGAGEHEGVLADREACAVDLVGQHPLGVLVVDLLEAALREGVAEPGKALAVLGQVLQSVSDVDPDQHFVVAELGGLHGQAHAVVEARENGVEVGDILGLDDLAGRAEACIGPDDLVRRGRRGDGDLPGGGVFGQDRLFAAGHRLGRGHEHQRPFAGERRLERG